ncbi:LppU family putative lipoprotein [Pseudonocardia humida]|uniref:Uncharacterized protein n=1 Tax=Pseudonocardia humida TaxID=2800819 RepID=A0ABT0ZWI4_9PSEU|nr:hypothetical protein [Pseudonocardia humida]MCO1655019.1 hypothetical protein [Pseudonocardia humida]
MTTPGQYGGPVGTDGPTRPVNPPGGHPQQGPGGTQYGPPAGGGYPGPGGGGYPPPGQYGGQGGGWPQPGGGWPPPGPGQFPPPFQPPPGRPSSSSGLVIGIVVAVVVLLGGGGAAWYFLAGPGSGDGSATPTASGQAPSSPAATNATAPTSSPGILPGADSGGDVDSVDVEVGECITLGGSQFAATADEATCGSPESNFKVIAKTENSDGCPTDADQTYYETLGGSEQGALCLDIDWVEGDCFELSGGVPERIDCSTPGLDTVRVGETVEGTTSLTACPDESFAYDERQFVVCIEAV